KKKISEETRQRVLKVIEETGFVPDLNARVQRGQESGRGKFSGQRAGEGCPGVRSGGK
ncbi:MAG: LacI family transcriptional regulator, partial [Lachnospiraceae bacterium]|nr:LacI family transcriptional regulator [Lachnospiraceae bacterium]